MRRASPLIALMAVLIAPGSSLGVHGAPPSLARAPTQDPADAVFRVNVDLVQLDAIVTDRQGRQVTDLRPDELEVLQDGKPQRIVAVSYVTTFGTATAAPPRRGLDDLVREASGTAPAAARVAASSGRTVAVVLDDASLSFASVAWIRETLRTVIDRDLQPGDVMGIMQTGVRGAAARQGVNVEFTGDKGRLREIAAGLKWDVASARGDDPQGCLSCQTARVDGFLDQVFTTGTLGALNSLVGNMRGLRGRKSLVFFSNRMPLRTLDWGRPIALPSADVVEGVRRVAELASRSGIVVYPVHATGLQTPALGVDRRGPAVPLERTSQYREESQEGLHMLADGTGGFLVKDQNDFAAAFKRVLEHQSGYYLIGYQPPTSTFDHGGRRPAFHNVTVRAKRPGVEVKTRSGFYGITDEEVKRRRSN